MNTTLHEPEKEQTNINEQVTSTSSYSTPIMEQLSRLFDESDEDEEPIDNTQD